MTAIVTRGDAGNLHLPDGTVDLVVTSPPYFGLRSYQDGGEHYAEQIGAEATPAEYLDALMACTAEWVRVLKPGGSIFVNLGDKYAGSANGKPHTGAAMASSVKRAAQSTGTGRAPETDIRAKSLMGMPWRYAIRCIDELGLILRAEIVWAKPNGLPESVTDRVRRAHEQVFHFVKQPRYYSAVDEIREEHLHGGRGPTWEERKAAGQAMRHGDTGGGASSGAPGPKAGNPLGKLPGSVWTIPTAPLRVPAELGIDHFAAYPPELVRRIVLGWSPAPGVVLDPFGGTGTTALVASVHGRVGISVDLSADYCRLAEWRTTDEKQRAKATGVKPKAPKKPKPEPIADVIELPGQLDLTEEWTA